MKKIELKDSKEKYFMNKEQKMTFQTFGVTNDVDVCGPDGCIIADHHKQVTEEENKDK